MTCGYSLSRQADPREIRDLNRVDARVQAEDLRWALDVIDTARQLDSRRSHAVPAADRCVGEVQAHRHVSAEAADPSRAQSDDPSEEDVIERREREISGVVGEDTRDRA